MGLLMAPPSGGGDQGGLGERPAHPKPFGGVSVDLGLRRSATRDADGLLEEDGNWDDGRARDAMGLPQGPETHIGGIVDMEDDVFLEFDEEEEVEKVPSEPTSWKLLARYMANFKPNTKAMFTRFTEEVWRLRSGIRYSEKGKNYYMITLFSKGDYDFVKRGGPWIFDQHALIVKDLDEDAQPSETALTAVPVWVRIYDVPWGKQDEVWGMRYGNGLGEALEVDVPASEQEKKEFLRVRVNLPYDRRLQTQIVTGVKGKREVKVFKLKYERVPYFCSHCGFMGHKKDECEKRRLGTPSLDYDAHELRCSPYKKFEHRTYFMPPAGQASVKRGLSFTSFGSAESFKRFDQRTTRVQRRDSVTPDNVTSRSGYGQEEMPPLMDENVCPVQEGALAQGTMRGATEVATLPLQPEVESNLAAKVDAMLVESGWDERKEANQTRMDASKPIIQFPDEEGQDMNLNQPGHVHLGMSADVLEQVQRLQAQQSAASSGSSWGFGPRPSDMIPALQGLSNLQVSFGSMSDVSMAPADTILGKRGAEEQEVQGERLELALGLGYDGKKDQGTPKKGKTQGLVRGQADKRTVAVVYKRNKKTEATGNKPAGNLTRPNVWSRQGQ
jgi:hypothetical protein